MSEFRDPLDELLQKHKDSEEHKPINDEEVVEMNETVSQEEDIYGDNDIELEMKQEEEQERVLHEQKVQEHLVEKKESEEFYQKAPGRSLDPQFIDESVSFQADKIEDVNLMVQKVLAEKEIYEGYFPADKKMHILGDLMEEYHKAVGTEPTQKFKDIVLRNWISPNKMREDAEKNATKGKCATAGCVLLPMGAALTIVGIPLNVHGKRIAEMNINYTGNGAGLSFNF